MGTFRGRADRNCRVGGAPGVRRGVAEAGGIGLFVDAIDERAADYYHRLGFKSSPDNPLLLFLSSQVCG